MCGHKCIIWLLLVGIVGVFGNLYGPGSPVSVLSGADFDKAIKTNGVAIVEFYADWCGHCKAFASKVESTAKVLKNVIPVVAVNEESLVQRYNIEGFPSVKIFIGNGPHKDPTVVDYTGQRDVDPLVKFAMKNLNKHIRSKVDALLSKSKSNGGGGPKVSKANATTTFGQGATVTELTQANFASVVGTDEANLWLVLFYAPWCGHCKQLEPHWQTLGRLADKVPRIKIGRVDCTVNTSLAAQFNVEGYPTIYLLPQGSKDRASAILYTGPRTSSDLLDFGKSHLINYGPPDKVDSLEQLKTYCDGPLCIFSILPKENLSHYLDVLSTVMKSKTRVPFRFCYTLEGEHPQWQEALGLNTFPAIVGLHTGRSIISVHQTGFTNKNIAAFVDALSWGKAHVGTLEQPLTAYGKFDKEKDEKHSEL